MSLTLVQDQVGITQAIGSYGQIVQKLYGLQRGLLQSDPVVNYLSYWTELGHTLECVWAHWHPMTHSESMRAFVGD